MHFLLCSLINVCLYSFLSTVFSVINALFIVLTLTMMKMDTGVERSWNYDAAHLTQDRQKLKDACVYHGIDSPL